MHITPNVQDRLLIASIIIFGVILIITFSITLYQYHLEQKEFDNCIQENNQRKDQVEYCKYIIFK